MASRPVWEGHLRLSLVTCPVALYSATTRANDVSFNLLNPETGNRIRMVPHDPDTGEVKRSDLVRGFEIAKDRFVTVTDEEIAAVRLPSTRSIDIETFVEESEIDRIYWNDPYYLVPSGTTGVEAFEKENFQSLVSQLENVWRVLRERGIDFDLLLSRSLLSPATCCLVNPDREKTVEKAFDQIRRISRLMREHYRIGS